MQKYTFFLDKRVIICRFTGEVARYFEKENRPFSLMDVANALRNHGKTALAKAIDELVEEEYLKEKVYGKQKVYVYDQSKLPVFDEDELKLLDSEITTLSHELSDCDLELKRISSSLTKEEAERKLMETEVEVMFL
ncbi:26S proteasome regulatory subunit, ATPase 3, interacting protein [Paragonimus westermani]|uniref:26S proteasome regulatory subunit, ATPase 3, interacting protein n=1 Tax=Paragonimus westermani TaxID=34504 RepID=A0A5J4N877_9TREM|nr:26S proteasome regulatory subunit, ATPase 3, interacting protein [Paragonimus westermani]